MTYRLIGTQRVIWGRSLSNFTLAASLTICGCLIGAVRASEDYQIHERVVPPGCECEAGFFETLKFAHPPEGIFIASKAPHWDLTKVRAFIAPEGIAFTDVNNKYSGAISRNSILRQLESRNGKIFIAFAHLAHIYSIPYRQYSDLLFATTPEGQVVVNMAGWYSITFRASSSGCLVTNWDYTMLEGE